MATERIDIPMGRMDVSAYDEHLPPSTLRAVVNAAAMGTPEQIYYTPIGSPLMRFGGLRDVLAVGRHVRQRVGRLASPSAPEALERLVVVTARYVLTVDPDTWAMRTVWDFGNTDRTRKAQFAQVGESLFIAVSRGDGLGEPDVTLVLEDDTCARFEVPPPPAIQVWTTGGDDYAGAPGMYAFRAAWAFKDGTTGSGSGPMTIETGNAHRGYKFSFALQEDAIGAIHPYWLDRITGVAILAAPPEVRGDDDYAPSVDDLMARPFYHVATISTAEGGDE